MIYKNLILILIFLYNGCSNKNYEEIQLNKKNPIGIYGEKLSNGVIHNINYLLEYPEEYLDKNILVKGKISEVCPMRGCWLEIEDTINHEKIRVKVTDGEIVFPFSAKGKSLIAEGKFSKLILTEQKAKNWKAHLMLERGIKIDTSEIILNDQDLYEYRIFSKAAKIF